jgi:hypothetical protein
MSTPHRPARPHSRRVYWRRRIVVAAGLAAIIILIVVLATHAGSGDGSPRAGADAATTASGSAAGAAKGTASGSGSGGTPAPVACRAADVTVAAHTDRQAYPAGVFPRFSLSLTNTGAVPCRIDAGTGAQHYTITSGKDVYWRSVDCQTDSQKMVILLAPGKTVRSTPFTWGRIRSDPKTCYEKNPPLVPAGGATYRVRVSVDGIASARVPFILR